VPGRSRGISATALALAVTVGLTVAGCSGSSAPAAVPTTSPTTPAASTSAAPTAAQQLQALAAAGQTAAFRATYTAQQQHPSSRATWQVWRTKQSLRVDVATKQSTATLIQTPRATYSCSRAHGRKTCFRVAKAGEPVPALFRLLAQRLFSTALVELADHIARYSVTASAAAGGNGGTCFAVKAPKSKATTQVETATYCYNSTGILTSARYPNGNTVRLTHLSMNAPAHDAFVPYAKPTPLPS